MQNSLSEGGGKHQFHYLFSLLPQISPKKITSRHNEHTICPQFASVSLDIAPIQNSRAAFQFPISVPGFITLAALILLIPIHFCPSCLWFENKNCNKASPSSNLKRPGWFWSTLPRCRRPGSDPWNLPEPSARRAFFHPCNSGRFVVVVRAQPPRNTLSLQRLCCCSTLYYFPQASSIIHTAVASNIQRRDGAESSFVFF